MTLPCTAVMKEDKWTGMKDSRRTVAKKGDRVQVYNVDHDPVYLCTNDKNETFSIHKDNLIIK